jgi:hypothetical protein
MRATTILYLKKIQTLLFDFSSPLHLASTILCTNKNTKEDRHARSQHSHASKTRLEHSRKRGKHTPVTNRDKYIYQMTCPSTLPPRPPLD